MINGESYKVIVAEAAKNALADADGESIERVFITAPADGRRQVRRRRSASASARTSSTSSRPRPRWCAMGGAVHVFKPRSTGEGFGRSWYPPFNSGASAFFTIYGRRRDDLPGSPVHPGPLQGRLRPGRRLVPAVQVRSPPTPRAATTCRTTPPSWRSGSPTAR